MRAYFVSLLRLLMFIRTCAPPMATTEWSGISTDAARRHSSTATAYQLPAASWVMSTRLRPGTLLAAAAADKDAAAAEEEALDELVLEEELDLALDPTAAAFGDDSGGFDPCASLRDDPPAAAPETCTCVR